jgi:hypothetical protein
MGGANAATFDLMTRTLMLVVRALMDSVVTAVGFLDAAQPADAAGEDEGGLLQPVDESVVEWGSPSIYELPPAATQAVADESEAPEPTWAAGWLHVRGAFNGLTDSAIAVKFDRSKVSLHSTGYFALGFALYSARILVYPIWTMTPYIPIVCPIYDEGRNWLESPYFESILCHVVAGMVAMILCAFQLNARLRQRFPVMHRWNGRIYVGAGVACVFALQPLQAVVGKGRFQAPSPYMQGMVFASSALWVIFTAKGVLAARRQQFQVHKRWMLRSAAVLAVPVTQRFFVFWFTLACMGLHWILYGGERWPAYAKPPLGSAVDTPDVIEVQDAGEVTLSLEGWGRAEIETFSLRFVPYVQTLSLEY